MALLSRILITSFATKCDNNSHYQSRWICVVKEVCFEGINLPRRYIANGHYTAIVKDRTHNRWWHCDDRTVIRCGQNVFRSASVYLVFYEEVHINSFFFVFYLFLFIYFLFVFVFVRFCFYFLVFLCGNAECWSPVTLVRERQPPSVTSPRPYMFW